MRRLNQIVLNGAAVVVTAVVVTVVFLAISYGADVAKNDFVSRLFLTMSGAAMSVFMTLTIVQWAIKEDRDKQWHAVKLRTYLLILTDLSNIALSFHLYHTQFVGIKDLDNYIQVLRKGIYDPNEAVSNAIIKFAEEATKLIPSRAKHSEETFKNAKMLITFYDNTNIVLNDLKLILIPRVLQLSDDDEIRMKLSDLEYMCSKLQRSGYRLKYPMEMGMLSMFDYNLFIGDVIKFIKNSGQIYDAIWKEIKPDLPSPVSEEARP